MQTNSFQTAAPQVKIEFDEEEEESRQEEDIERLVKVLSFYSDKQLNRLCLEIFTVTRNLQKQRRRRYFDFLKKQKRPLLYSSANFSFVRCKER